MLTKLDNICHLSTASGFRQSLL